MTLKVRNKFMKIFMYVSIISLILSLTVFLSALLLGKSVSTPDLRFPLFISEIPFFRQDLVPTVISFALLFLYVPAVIFYMFRYFENTQASEIIFFSAFLLGILCETARFYTIFFNVWQTFTNLLIFLGNIVLFGRILVPLSFVSSSLFSDIEMRQDIERNYMLMAVAAVVFALIIPLNTARITSTGYVTEGSMYLLNGARFLLMILASLSFYIKSALHANKDFAVLGNWILVLYSGYVLLISADNYVFMLSGTALLYTGTYFYLNCLHKMYMWL